MATPCRSITCPAGETCFDGSCRPDTFECATDADCPGDRNACTFSSTLGASCQIWAEAPGSTADPSQGPLDGTWNGYKYDFLRRAWLEANFFGTFDIVQAPQTTAFSGDFTWSDTGETGSFTGDAAAARFAFSTVIDSKTYEFTDCVIVSEHYVGCQFDDPNDSNNARAVALFRQ